MLCTVSSATAEESPNVVTDILPVHSLVSQVMKGVGSPAVILAPGLSPHFYSLKPSDARALGSADLVVQIGEPLTPWLAKSVGEIAPQALRLELLTVDGTVLLDARGVHDHDDHDNHDDHDDRDDHEDNDDGSVDPHAWLNPSNGMLWLSNIAEALSEIDPENAALYRANAKEGIEAIAAAETRVSASLSKAHSVAVYHDTYQYFEQYFGLDAPLMLAEYDATIAGASHLDEVKSELAEGQIACLLAEPSHNPALVARITEGADVGFRVLDAIGADLELGPGLYPALFDQVADAHTNCGN